MTARIAIVDVDAKVPLDERERVAAALQRQAIEHFMPAWGVGATVRAATPASPPQPGEWVAELRDGLVPSDGSDALAVHDVQPDGTPVIRVDVGACRKYGDQWSSALSHEVCEALADPDIVRAAQDPSGRFWCLEVCDAVENDAYIIDGVEVSNFCLPGWFAPAKALGQKFDYLGKCVSPFQVRPGGYAQQWDPAKGWKQLGQMTAYRKHLARLGAGRSKRRPRPAKRSAVARAVRWLLSLPGDVTTAIVDFARRN